MTRSDAVEWLSITRYDTDRSRSAQLAAGRGETRAHVVRFHAGGRIGAHEAGFGQLFTFVVGRGWVAGPDGRRVPLVPGDFAWFARGEVHSKGSDDGGTALMIQVTGFEPEPTRATRVSPIRAGRVSRRHLRLSATGSRVTVQDLGSTNGTFLDGARLASSTTLSSPERLLAEVRRCAPGPRARNPCRSPRPR